MKLLEFRDIAKNDVFYFVALECDEERDCYKWTHERMNDGQLLREDRAYYEGYWDCYMTEALDNDISNAGVFYYFVERGEELPKIGEVFTLDGVEFERVA